MIRRISTAVAAFATITLLMAAAVPSAADPVSTCGDSCVAGPEACDDGNTTSGDGCSEFCVTESCYDCSGAASASGRGGCTPSDCILDILCVTCGNGCIDESETCDDGNTARGDGCDPSCAEENCYTCSEINVSAQNARGPSCTPSTCSPDENVECSCGNKSCDQWENCENCPLDCGSCAPTGACCTPNGCYEVSQDLCEFEYLGTYHGDSTSCETEDICVNCGDGCRDFGESCDDGNTGSGDGCDDQCGVEGCFDCAPEALPTSVGTVCNGPDVCSPDLECSCGNETCDAWESCETCSSDCDACVTGACCTPNGCYDVASQGLCEGEYLGTYHGDNTSCETESICVNCGDGCKDFGESCDDGNTDSGDGCDESCLEENCFNCSPPPTDTLPSQVIGPVCMGPYTCDVDPACDVCGDNEVGESEDCDDGNTDDGDCCSANCTWESAGSACPDEFFCNGAETCNGTGTCQPATPVSCSHLTTECADGVCNEASDSCVADTSGKEGNSCTDDSTCTVPGTGICTDGTCTGEGTTLSPTCRWIIVGGPAESGRATKVRNGEDSILRGSTCGQTGRSSGKTLGSLVVTADVGEGARFDALAEVGGDIVTGGASLTASTYAFIPGTLLTNIAGGAPAVDKLPSGQADTTGTNPLFDECLDDQAKLTLAKPILDAMTVIPAHHRDLANFKVPVGGSQTLDITGHDLEIIDMSSFRIARKATLTLKGLPTDVLLIRVEDGRFSLGFGTKVVLDGLKPENVLFYSKASRACRFSKRAMGAGTVFCPDASKIIVGVGSQWTGTFLGGKREVRVRFYADLTHKAFTGF